MDCIDHGVTKSQKRLSDFHFYFQWLGLYAFTAEGLDSIPGQWAKIPQAIQQGENNK